MAGRIRGAHVLITGGGSGIGRLMALGAAQRGAHRVIVWDLSDRAADSVRDEVPGARRQVRVVRHRRHRPGRRPATARRTDGLPLLHRHRHVRRRPDEVAGLLPILDPQDASDRILRAIDRGQALLVMPPAIRAVPLLRMLPTSWFDRATDLFGVNNTMDRFTGRPG